MESSSSDEAEVLPHADEPHDGGLPGRLNSLRAAVLGANDGIVSTAGIVVGVSGATTDQSTLLLTGMAGLVAGSLSMAGGEYVSVSSQRDTEQALLDKERDELERMPRTELTELTELYRQKGLAPDTAADVARQLTEQDALAAHAEVELGIDPDELTSPIQAALSSMIAFALGAALPLLSIVLLPVAGRTSGTVVAVTTALALTGYLSARIGRAPTLPAIARNVAIGLLAMGVTWVVGTLIGVNGM